MEVVKTTANEVVDASAPVTADMATNGAPEAVRLASDSISTIATSAPLWQNIALWFLIGGVFAIIVFLLWNC